MKREKRKWLDSEDWRRLEALFIGLLLGGALVHNLWEIKTNNTSKQNTRGYSETGSKEMAGGVR
jgi:hypothetical protein